MDQGWRRCWNLFTLQPTKTLFLEMCLPWFLVASEWVKPPRGYFVLVLLVLSNLATFFCTSGTPALTSRGFVEEDFAKVAEFFDAAVKLAVKIKGETKGSYQLSSMVLQCSAWLLNLLTWDCIIFATLFFFCF